MASIIIKNLQKSFGDNEIIKNIDLVIDDGDCTVLVGPSGCGKSTLLRLICGLEEITSGYIRINDVIVNDVAASDRGLAMVFQSYALYPHMTVYENMAFALKVRKLSKEEMDERVLSAAEILKIKNLLHRKPKELSGGQRQRVAIGRAIVRKPSAFLFDEPLSNLDASLRKQMRYELAKLKETLNTTMIYVTHDQEEAMTLADKIVVLNDGKIEQVGTPMELYFLPKNIFVACFIGSPKMNLLDVIVNADEKEITLQLDSGDFIVMPNKYKLRIVNKKYTLGIRPEDIKIVISSHDDCILAQILLIENLGSEALIHAKIANNTINIRLPGQHFYNKDDAIAVKFGNNFYLFDENGENIFWQKRENAEGIVGLNGNVVGNNIGNSGCLSGGSNGGGWNARIGDGMRRQQ